MNAEKFRLITFLIALVIVLGICFLLVKPFLYIFAWSLILSVISYPLYKRLLQRFRTPSLCSILTVFIAILMVIIPVTIACVYAVKEGILFVNNIRDFIYAAKASNYTDLANIPIIKNIYKIINDFEGAFGIDFKPLLEEKIESASSFFIKNAIGFFRNIIGGLVQLIMVLFVFYFMLKDSDKLLRGIKIYLPLNEDQSEALIMKVGDTIYSTVYVALIVAIVQGSLGGLAFWVLGLKSPILWGTVIAVFCLIPFVGHPVVWLPTAISLVVSGLYWKAIVLVLWGMLVIGLIDNLIRTVLIGNKTELHPLMIFFSVLGGVLLIGPLGLLLGPVIIVTAMFLLDVLRLNLSK